MPAKYQTKRLPYTVRISWAAVRNGGAFWHCSEHRSSNAGLHVFRTREYKYTLCRAANAIVNINLAPATWVARSTMLLARQ